jgi:hypothetical protein
MTSPADVSKGRLTLALRRPSACQWSLIRSNSRFVRKRRVQNLAPPPKKQHQARTPAIRILPTSGPRGSREKDNLSTPARQPRLAQSRLDLAWLVDPPALTSTTRSFSSTHLLYSLPVIAFLANTSFQDSDRYSNIVSSTCRKEIGGLCCRANDDLHSRRQQLTRYGTLHFGTRHKTHTPNHGSPPSYKALSPFSRIRL